ncbi:PREDICTED: uncharacterized protein LOC107345426 [Acropora digitifera]|uniref:uncharacterized protein LOC107345426 n=1 Tax=Acropora digitifera TaxID=70779 RepID=UPI00077B1AA6|nr:PREDICTED: uncharacterized protein LOC107345426 [Acropora digitifera]
MWPEISPPTVKSTSLFTPCSSQVYACAGSALSQILAPPGLGATLPILWPTEQLNGATARTYLEYPTSHAPILGGQYLSPVSMMALAAPNFWSPDFPAYCGLHTAAQILMNMASK